MKLFFTIKLGNKTMRELISLLSGVWVVVVVALEDQKVLVAGIQVGLVID